MARQNSPFSRTCQGRETTRKLHHVFITFHPIWANKFHNFTVSYIGNHIRMLHTHPGHPRTPAWPKIKVLDFPQSEVHARSSDHWKDGTSSILLLLGMLAFYCSLKMHIAVPSSSSLFVLPPHCIVLGHFSSSPYIIFSSSPNCLCWILLCIWCPQILLFLPENSQKDKFIECNKFTCESKKALPWDSSIFCSMSVSK